MNIPMKNNEICEIGNIMGARTGTLYKFGPATVHSVEGLKNDDSEILSPLSLAGLSLFSPTHFILEMAPPEPQVISVEQKKKIYILFNSLQGTIGKSGESV
uniref:Uncharacterized protein n=1 Tax=Cacopsylla melanoneura TaxID=428564 RepID=A0A8D8VZD4_9HEMI